MKLLCAVYLPLLKGSGVKKKNTQLVSLIPYEMKTNFTSHIIHLFKLLPALWTVKKKSVLTILL